MTKITKLSLAALLALGTTASAADKKISVDGGVKMWVETQAAHGTEVTDKTSRSYGAGMFSPANTSGQFVSNLGLKVESGDVTFNTRIHSWTSMGIAYDVGDSVRITNNQYVTSAAAAPTTAAGAVHKMSGAFVGEANVTTTLPGATTMVVGRMELNTPFAFTEKWNAIPNTYEALVLVNNSVKDVTIIGAYVGAGNGAKGSVINAEGQFNDINARYTAAGASYDVDADGNYSNQQGGAYMIAASSKIALPVNAYYYVLPNHATAWWVDASKSVAGANIKVMAASLAADEGQDPTVKTDDIKGTTTGFAGVVGYKVAGVSLSGAYSMVGKGYAPLGNVGTGFKKTKLPTAGVYTDGLYVAQPDVKAFKIKAATKVAGFGVAAQFISASGGENKAGYTTNGVDNVGNGADAKTTTETDVFVTKKVGAIALKAIYMIRTGVENAAKTGTSINSTDAKDTKQSKLRIIASMKF